MVLYAHEKGHRISIYTTAVGMQPEDVYRLKDIPYAGEPFEITDPLYEELNGNFCLHLPDSELVANHPINKNYIETIAAFKEVHKDIQNFTVMCMGNRVHESVRHLFPTADIPKFWNRAGNLRKEKVLKRELALSWSKVLNSVVHQEPMTCGCNEHLYHGILLPNGDISLCCQDYALEHIIGNLYTQSFDEIMPKPETCFELCKSCHMARIPMIIGEPIVEWNKQIKVEE